MTSVMHLEQVRLCSHCSKDVKICQYDVMDALPCYARCAKYSDTPKASDKARR